MSSAIDAGLYHPRCKDSHVNYFDGLSDTPDEYTDEEKEELVNQYNAEQCANHVERQAERYGCLSNNALDPGDARAYNMRKSEWRKKEVLDNTEKGGNPISSNRVTKSEHDNSERTIESYSNYAKIDIDGIVAALKTSCDEQKLLFSKKSVSEELASSPVGIKTIERIFGSDVEITLINEHQRYTYRGEQSRNKIFVYLANIKNERVVAQTIIHEMTHYYYGIGNCQHAEAVCFAMEKMHILNREYLTVEEWNQMVKLAMDNYQELEWEAGGYGSYKQFDFVRK